MSHIPQIITSQSILSGSHQRFQRLHELYGRRVHAYIAARLGSHYAFSDSVAQQTWITVWRCLPALRAEDDKALAWLLAVARRSVVEHYLRARVQRELSTFLIAVRLMPTAASADDVALGVAA